MKLTKRILLLACACLVAKGFAQDHLVPGWIQLITKLDQYEGKDIYISGWCDVDGNGPTMRLWMSKFAAEAGQVEFCLVVDDASMVRYLKVEPEKMRMYHGKIIDLVGTVDSKGVPGNAIAFIKDIKSFTVYHKRHVPEVIGPAK
jgi:hypothetical protein